MNRKWSFFSEPVWSFPHISHTTPPSGRPTYYLIGYVLRSEGQREEPTPEVSVLPPVLLFLRKACCQGCLLLARADTLRRACSRLSETLPAPAFQLLLRVPVQDTQCRENDDFGVLEQTDHTCVTGGPAATVEAGR